MSDDLFEASEPSGDEFGRDELFPEQEELQSSRRRPLTARGLAIIGGRAAIGLVGVGVAVVAVVGSALLPLPDVEATAPSIRVTPVPTAQQLVCPGALLRLADDSGQDATTASGLGEAVISSGSSSGEVETVGASGSDAGTGDTPAAPSIVSTPPDPGKPNERIRLSGAQVQNVDDGDFAGLAAADCGIATGDTWLAGGATTTGRTTLITLTNPTEVPATVDLQLFGENGPISAPGTSGVIVPASGQRVLSLAGFLPGIVSPVVHVTSTGGRVDATLQQVVIRGLRPGGVDIVEGSSGPDTSTVIPGVVVTDTKAVQTLRNTTEDSSDDFATVLRLFAPGDGVVPVTVTVTPESGQGTASTFDYQLEAGVVDDVPFQDLQAGTYTISVDATEPTLSSARVSTAKGPATDFAWFTPAEALSSTTPVTAADGPSPRLHLFNPTDSDATVTIAALGKKGADVAVPSGEGVVVKLAAGRSYQLSGFDTIHAAVTLSAAGALAGYTVHSPGVGSAPITVYP